MQSTSTNILTKPKFCCREPGCCMSPSFNYIGYTNRVFCATHKKPGMINVVIEQAKIRQTKYTKIQYNDMIYIMARPMTLRDFLIAINQQSSIVNNSQFIHSMPATVSGIAPITHIGSRQHRITPVEQTLRKPYKMSVSFIIGSRPPHITPVEQTPIMPHKMSVSFITNPINM